MRIGFLGLGVMGTPMALNLSRRSALTVWNRSPGKYPPLVQAGARVAETPAELAEQSDIIFSMLFNETAIRAVLTDDFKKSLRNKTLVSSSSVSADFNQHLAGQVHEAGGHFIEMPVSGSKVPAERGQLIALMAGDPTVAEAVKPFVEPMTSATIYCGPIGTGLKMKYAVNLYLITMTVGLAEAMNLARAQGLDPEAFGAVLDAGPMASAHSRHKISKMIRQDWSAEAAIQDVYNNTRLIRSASDAVNAESPLIKVCESLYSQAAKSALAGEDMVAIIKLLAERL